MNCDHQILHSCLVQGKLSVSVTDIDIRRSGGQGTTGLISPIETDYILHIQSTDQSGLETFYSSKRYLDIRNLAYTLHSYAEEVVRYHASKLSSSGELTKSFMSRGNKLIKIFEKPIELLYYTTNTEPNSSDLAGELDNVLGNTPNRRTSMLLHKDAPLNVRDVLEAVDEFYETILSEKRQFGMKSNFAHLEKVAQRRRTLINDAFFNFIGALVRAGISNKILPPVLEKMIFGFEYFLLTDIVVDQESRASPQDVDILTSIRPKSVRRRASLVDREKERDTLRSSANELIVDEGSSTNRDVLNGTLGEKERKQIDVKAKVLPEDFTEFFKLVALGTIFFTIMRGHTVTIQLDIFAVTILACLLIGYHLTPNSSSESANKYTLAKSSVKIITHDVRHERPSMVRSTTAHHLIRASFRRVSAVLLPKQEPKVELKTFEMFPKGAEIGSHLNCWSIPDASNFHVRGATYLTDKKKIPSDNFLMPCRGCDLFLTDNPPSNIGRNVSLLAGKIRDVATFIINYRLPWGVFVTYHQIPEKFLPFLRRNHGYGDTSKPLPSQSEMSSGEKCLCNFFLSDDDEKNAVLKIVPVVVEGPWMVKRVVGGKPAIVGKQLPISYVYQPPQPELGLAEYLEADLDIVSSAAARNILAVVRSSVQVLTIDLGFVIQGNTKEELPEQMMAGLRIHGLDPLTADAFPDFDHEGIFEVDENGDD